MKLVVDREDIRIDKYLGENTEFSRELITKMLKEGYALVNGKITKPSYKTKLEDVVEIDDT